MLCASWPVCCWPSTALEKRPLIPPQDVGQEEDFEAAKEKALKIGAKKCYVEDLRREFIQELCFPAVQSVYHEDLFALASLTSWYQMQRHIRERLPARDLARSPSHRPCPDCRCTERRLLCRQPWLWVTREQCGARAQADDVER